MSTPNQGGIKEALTISSTQKIFSGMGKTVLPAVLVAHSTILHISLRNSPALPLMIIIEARLCRRAANADTPIEFIELYVQ